MSLRILQVSNRVPYPLNEGGTIGIYNYTKGFFDAGCEVTLLALQPNRHSNEQENANRVLSQFARFETFPIDTTVKPLAAFLNLFSNKSYNVERFYNKEFDQYLEKHLKENEYDVIQIEGTYPAVYSKTIFANSNALVSLRQHNVEYQIWERLASNTKNPIKKWYLNLLAKRLKSFEKRHLNIYSAVVPVTEDDGNLFKQMGCTVPVFASPAGIDMQVWKPSEEVNSMDLYHIGSLEWMPNLEAVDWFLQDIWPDLKKAHSELRFFVAGKRMPERMKNLKLEDVMMLGEVESATDFISDKGICVVPLLSGSGIRLKILEAMSAGKVVISTTIGAQGIDYINGENILIADTKEEFILAIASLKLDPGLANRLGNAAVKLIREQYSNESVVRKLVEFYEKRRSELQY